MKYFLVSASSRRFAGALCTKNIAKFYFIFLNQHDVNRKNKKMTKNHVIYYSYLIKELIFSK